MNAHFAMKIGKGRKKVIHEGYKNDLVSFDNDTALVRLEHKASVSTHVAPVCSPGKETAFG